ncbi:MAG TPA: hypothetical protein VHC69_17300 [Polyangiaceae bacterium]|nr:hypothetical protein [Polyangiaceae bacterium]
MLIYRNQATIETASTWLATLRADVARRPCVVSDARDLIVDAGDFETALADAEHPTEDGSSELGSTMRRASIALASSFVAALEGEGEAARAFRATAARVLASIDGTRLPRALERRVPEGFSRYCLFPEQYRAAALHVVAERTPRRAVVIGLRSVGTALSAVVHATLRSRGVDVESLTLRPRGHPFDRVLEVEPALRDALVRGAGGALYVVVDEGPGMSGSSFACVVDWLVGLGVGPPAVVLMPSWDADENALSSERARAVWATHRRYVAPFDPSWVGLLSGRDAREVSAGAWRDEPWATGAEVAVVPQHERRKFVFRRSRSKMSIARFAGFGRYGAAVRSRAEILAQAGFGPPSLAFEDGFLELELVPGTPLKKTAGERDALLDGLSRYASFVARTFHSASSIDVAGLLRMMRTNVAEALGGEYVSVLESFAERSPPPAEALVVDGRMAPHEWILTEHGITKTDAFEHGDDHFFPGPVDIAWDLAGAVVEFELSDRRRDQLLRRYIAASGDRSIVDRFGFYEAAYLAFRTGYADVAARLVDGDEVQGFRTLAATYGSRLRRRLEAGAP